MLDENLQSLQDENYQSLFHSPGDPKVWKKRGFLVLKHCDDNDLMEELVRVEKFAEQHPKNYLICIPAILTFQINSILPDRDYRRRIIEDIGYKAIINELKFTEKILMAKGTKNYLAWSHRQSIIKKSSNRFWLDELKFCHKILDKDKFNVSAWEQICHTVNLLRPYMSNVLRDNETTYAKKAIYAQPGNEGPWIYLKFLYADDKTRLYTNPDLECIYVDVLDAAAYRLKSTAELDPSYKVPYASVDNRGCIHALNLIVDLMALGYPADRNRKLVEAVDVLVDKSPPPLSSWSEVPYFFRRMNSEIVLKVHSLMCSLDASRIRYCYMYNGSLDIRLRPGTVDKTVETVTMDIPLHCVTYSQSQEMLNSILDGFIMSFCEEHKVFKAVLSLNPESRLVWREQLYKRLSQSYLQKQKGCEIAAYDTLEDLKWDLRQFLVKNIGITAVASAELDYTMGIINEDAYNRHAWSHRQWVLQTFSEDWVDEDGAEIEFCGKILDKDSCNGFAWDQRCFVVTRWIPIIEATYKFYSGHRVEPGDDVFNEIRKVEESYERVRSREINYAINMIGSEPENPFPWSHIHGVCSAYPTTCHADRNVRDTILGVLQGERDCVVGLGAIGEGIMGNRVASLVNARGVVNALNMLLDIFIICRKITSIKEDEEEKYKDVLKVLCPDSSVPIPEYHINIIHRTNAIMRHLRKGLAGHGLLWENAADSYLDPYYCD
ncbi:hypothetical protein CASFOL_007010 [Castilleja foliolosa]|uniref:Protein farnesyltransferase/geranylgeranyltransferase type-1 subunit alpha n=1 Tax=Castilleja foliolosa TaxID=1961234 RepID=A0ABD3E8K2_9LAMI